jgi:hypothetical protein
MGVTVEALAQVSMEPQVQVVVVVAVVQLVLVEMLAVVVG